MLIASMGCLFGALACFCAYHLSIYSELRESRRETSRFPMFAARDRLVRLVLDHEVDEDNPAWRHLYSGVNFWLSLDRSYHALDWVWRYLKYIAQAVTNPDLRRRHDSVKRELDQAADQIPAFREALRSTNVAFDHMIKRRTNAWHITCSWMLLVSVRLLLTALQGGLKVAAAFYSAAGKITANDVAIWGDATCQTGTHSSANRLARM